MAFCPWKKNKKLLIFRCRDVSPSYLLTYVSFKHSSVLRGRKYTETERSQRAVGGVHTKPFREQSVWACVLCWTLCICSMFGNVRWNLCSPSLQYIHSAGIIHRVSILTFLTVAIVSYSLSVCVYWSCSPEGMVLGNVLICFLAKSQNRPLNSFSGECQWLEGRYSN